jgi:hypothetical protein
MRFLLALFLLLPVYAFSASSEHLRTGSAQDQKAALCKGHVLQVMEFGSAEAASANFEEWVAQGRGNATNEDYVAMVRQMIQDVYTKGPQEAFNACLGSRT